jgi:hypothetical protein
VASLRLAGRLGKSTFRYASRDGAVLVLERINTPEPPHYLILVFLAFFLVLGFLIMSAEEFATGINPDGCFLAILAYDCVV